MAIYSAVPPPSEQAPEANTQHQATPVMNSAIDIDAWTISALESLSVSPIARGIGSPLAIPIDDETKVRIEKSSNVTFTETPVTPPKRPLSRRDSQRTREMLMKGKEGSRQRRRWENDRLMHVPNVQPPQPCDWQVHATHPVHRVPYQIAQFWDRGVRQSIEDKTLKLQVARKKQQLQTGRATGLGVGEVPRDLREAAKRSAVVKTWVRALEEPVRGYLVAQVDEEVDSAAEQMSSDDEEIVFVGRNGKMREGQTRWKMARREVSQGTVEAGMVMDSFGDDETAAFKRWLTHSISDYYGLESRSLTLDARRVVYVGLRQVHRKSQTLPRPLWEIC